MNLESLAARLDVLEAQDAIRGLKAAYMQACDDRKGRAIADLFWDDGVWEGIGGSSGWYEGHEAIAEMFEATPLRLTFTTHYLTNETISVKGDTATGQWKLLEPIVYRDSVALWMGGRYIDQFTRRDGEWRLSHLKLDVTFRTSFHKGWHEERFANLAAYDTP